METSTSAFVNLTIVRTPAGAAHVAFPAPSKEAVNSFFVSALKSGGKIHGEPKTRDPDSGYYSAAVVDFDGNSIEAVYRPESSSSSGRSQTGAPALKVIKNGSVVSRARSSKAESVAPPRSEVKSVSSKYIPAIENVAPASAMPPMYEQSIHHLTYPVQAQEQADNGSKAAKTIIGTLLGATAGAAIAYAIVKGDSTSSSPPQPPPVPQYAPQASAPIIPSEIFQAPPSYRALEAPPARSSFSAKEAYSICSRSVSSKNPRADTVYEDTEYYPAIGSGESVYSRQSGVRRSSSGSVYATRDLPIRAIEYPPPSRSQTFPYNPSTFISSYAEKSRHSGDGHNADDDEVETEFSSISTIKPARSHSSRRSSSHSQYSKSSHLQPSHYPIASRGSSSHRPSTRESKSGSIAAAGGGSVYSSRSSARNVPLPEGSAASFSLYSSPKSVSSSRIYSPRNIPLPDSATPSTVFLDAVDVDTHITPDDSISQVGENHRSSSRSHSHHSRRSSSHSRHSKSAASHASSKRSSKFDEPVRPSDSISQVSTNISRSSDRTVKVSGGGGSASKTSSGSKAAHSSSHSKSASKVSQR
jgi:hypothetical protein